MKRVLATTAGLGLAITLAGVATTARAAEGMWTFDNPPLKAMQQEIGWAPSPAWLDKVMHASARIANGCSASFVSAGGLVLTNHHCVAGCVEDLSTPEQDLLKAGFLARQPSEEKRCQAMEVNRLEQITDVTAQLTQATAGLEGTAYKAARNAAEARITSACVGSEGKKLRCDVVDLYHGGQFKLYRYRRFQDVRLVFAPEIAAAAFGGDPDNFNFPRYDLDMGLLRVYDNDRPIAVTDFFRFNPVGAAAGEPVIVTGHPGSTQRELTAAQLALLRDRLLLDTLMRLAEYRGLLTAYRDTGPEPARTAAAELFFVENYYKVVQGQLKALLDPQVFQRKEADEAALRRYVAGTPALAAKVGGAWDAIAQAERVHRNLAPLYGLLEDGRAFRCDYFYFARTLVRGAAERAKPDAERLPDFNESALPQVEAELMSTAPVYPALQKLKLTFALTKLREQLGADSPLVQRVLGKESPSQLAARLVGSTQLADPALRKQLWEGGAAAIANSTDPFIQLALAVDPEARALRTRYEREVEAVVQKNTELIAQARFAMAGDGQYPDATFTLRLSYGVVKGWDEAGTPVPPFTQMGGAFARATGAEPYALPPSWLRHQPQIDAATPLNLATTNDIIGGNSGSPMLNRNGELVGLVFDGNIHSLGGSYLYEPEINRAVAVHSAGMLEALDKIYGAAALAQELRGR